MKKRVRRSRAKAAPPTVPVLPANLPTPPDEQIERLSTDDLSYHQRTITQLKERQAGLDAAKLVLREWGGHLVEKYKITEADVIREDGSIVRGGKGIAGTGE